MNGDQSWIPYCSDDAARVEHRKHLEHREPCLEGKLFPVGRRQRHLASAIAAQPLEQRKYAPPPKKNNKKQKTNVDGSTLGGGCLRGKKHREHPRQCCWRRDASSQIVAAKFKRPPRLPVPPRPTATQ